MLKTLSRLALCAILAAGGLAARGEGSAGITGHYWFDTSGEKHTFIPGSLEIPTDGLDEGFHTFNAYVADTAGVSVTHSKWFLKLNRKPNEPLTYWFDSSGKKSIERLGILEIPTDSLDEGFHTFNAYVGEKANISSTHTKLFLKTSRILNENEPLTCSFYLDGKVFQTHKVPVGANGTFGISLDVDSVDLGVHALGMMLASGDGLPMGYREAVFMRVPSDLQRSTFKAYYYLDGKYAGDMEGGTNNPLVHLDIDASALTSGLHSVTIYLASPHGMATSTKTAWFVKIPAGGEGVRQYAYWINDNAETMQTVDLPEVTNPFGLVRLFDVPEQPFRSHSHTFAIEDGAPVLYACNDFNIRFTDPDGRVSTGSRTYTDVRVKTVPDEVTSIATGRANTGNIAANTVKLFRFDAEIGDSINVRLDRAGMLEVYAPDAQALVRATGADATANRSLTARQNGTYYVAVHDIVYGNEANVDFSHIHKFALLEQSVSRSANRGVFEMNVTGNGFDSLDSLTLTDGNSEIPVGELTIVDNYSLRAVIDFDENKPNMGEYRLKGLFSDKEKNAVEEILSSAVLTVEEAKEDEIAVEIEPSRKIGTPYQTYIKVTNRSNVGKWGVPLGIAVRHTERGGTVDFLDFQIVNDRQFEDSVPVVYETADLLGTGSTGSFAPMLIPYLGPNETKTFTIGYTTAPHEIVPTYAWAGKPWSDELAEMSAEGYDLSKVEEPIYGNSFSFLDFCRLFHDLENNGCLDYSESELDAPETIASNMAVKSPRTKVVKVAYYGQVARSGFSYANSGAYALYQIPVAGTTMPIGYTGQGYFAHTGAKTIYNTYNFQSIFNSGLVRYKITFNRDGGSRLSNTHPNWANDVPPDGADLSLGNIDCYQSGDPNDMKGYQSPSGTNHIGRSVKTLNYTIEFENDPEIANAPASTINVKSVADASTLDLATFRALTLTIGDKEIDLPEGHHFVRTLDMRPAINAIAELTFDFDSKTGLAEWKLRSLDPLTLDEVTYLEDGILPVNDDSGRGTGFLTFSIGLRPNLSDGTEISAGAEIVFDQNQPIPTPVWTNVTDYTVPRAKIVSQSTTDKLTFDFTAEGSDSGSGIWFYDLYMKADGSDKWIAVKTGIEGDSFSYTSPTAIENATFAVLATDRAGNRQSEASLNALAGDADDNGAIDSNDVVATRNYYLGNPVNLNTMNADVTADGRIDTQDATAIINLYLEKTETKSIKKLIIR